MRVFFILLLLHIACRSPIWDMWVGMLLHFIEKRLLTLFLGFTELRNFYTIVKNEATVDAFVDMYIAH